MTSSCLQGLPFHNPVYNTQSISCMQAVIIWKVNHPVYCSWVQQGVSKASHPTCIVYIYKQGGLLRSPPATPNSPLLSSHSYIPAHMHAIRCCKQGCERADLAHMESSKEKVKGTDYVNSMRLILQLYSIICGACAFISPCLGHVT